MMTKEKYKEFITTCGIPLKSVDCVLDSVRGIIYPMLADGSTDLTDDGTSLLSVTDEWLDNLSEDDMWKINKASDDLDFNIEMEISSKGDNRFKPSIRLSKGDNVKFK
jgi:hypothetical protein|tara:strand:+ start:1995 stop:2318 length:324 start_codon:yes stop_codon:yes gene_type:complete